MCREVVMVKQEGEKAFRPVLLMDVVMRGCGEDLSGHSLRLHSKLELIGDEANRWPWAGEAVVVAMVRGYARVARFSWDRQGGMVFLGPEYLYEVEITKRGKGLCASYSPRKPEGFKLPPAWERELIEPVMDQVLGMDMLSCLLWDIG